MSKIKTTDKRPYVSEEIIRLSEANPSLVNILWTGGLDSSFTMAYLSKFDITIQPYYVSGTRKSEKYELNAIAELTIDITEHSETRCNILPLKIFKSSEIVPDPEITNAYQRLYEKTGIGTQYDWLARIAKSISGLMLNIEKSNHSKIHNCIKEYGYLKRVKEGDVSYLVLDEKRSSEDLVLILKSFRMPLPLFETTKPEIYEYFKKLGFEASANKTWFCFTPIGDRPCGICNPCKAAIGDGMTQRFTKEALRRYERDKKIRILKNWIKATAKRVFAKLGLLKTAERILGKV